MRDRTTGIRRGSAVRILDGLRISGLQYRVMLQRTWSWFKTLGRSAKKAEAPSTANKVSVRSKNAWPTVRLSATPPVISTSRPLMARPASVFRVTNSQLKIPWKSILNSLTAYWISIFIPWQLYFSYDYSLTLLEFLIFSLDWMVNSLTVKGKP